MLLYGQPQTCCPAFVHRSEAELTLEASLNRSEAFRVSEPYLPRSAAVAPLIAPVANGWMKEAKPPATHAHSTSTSW